MPSLVWVKSYTLSRGAFAVRDCRLAKSRLIHVYLLEESTVSLWGSRRREKCYQLAGSTKFRNCFWHRALASDARLSRFCTIGGVIGNRLAAGVQFSLHIGWQLQFIAKTIRWCQKSVWRNAYQLETAVPAVFDLMRDWKVSSCGGLVLTLPLMNLSWKPLFLKHDIASGQPKALKNAKLPEGHSGRESFCVCQSYTLRCKVPRGWRWVPGGWRPLTPGFDCL